MIAGGSGLIGRHLAAELLARGDEVIVLSREPRATQQHLRGAAVLPWTPGLDGCWQPELEGVDAVVNLAGAPFFTNSRDDYYKRVVLGSRRRAIESLLEALENTRHRPIAFISASSTAVYGFRRDNQILTEDYEPDIEPISKDAVELENLALDGAKLSTRVVLLRTAMVLARDGGAIAQLARAAEYEPAKPVEPGTQWCSWIHIRDAVGLIVRAIDDASIHGPLNVTSPNPIRNWELAQSFADAFSRPLGPSIRATELHHAVRNAAITLTHGQRVLPARALTLGYQFRHPTLKNALHDLVGASSHAGLPRPSMATTHMGGS